MLRRRYKRLVSFFVPVFFILCIIYTWSSLNVKKDVVRMFQSKHDSGLFDKIHMNDNVYNALRLHNEPEIYNISYLTTLGKIITADDQRKFDEGYFYFFMCSFVIICCLFLVLVLHFCVLTHSVSTYYYLCIMTFICLNYQ